MLKRLFPHPYLTLTLIVLWFLLVNHWKLGSLVMAAILGTAIPLLTSGWWPDRPRIKRPFALAAYGVLVFWDVIVANFQVARIVLFMPRDRIQSASDWLEWIEEGELGIARPPEPARVAEARPPHAPAPQSGGLVAANKGYLIGIGAVLALAALAGLWSLLT